MPVPSDTSAETSRLIEDGLAYHQAGRAKEAESAYTRVLALDPHEPEALNLLGLLLQDRGEIQRSIDLLSRAVAADPDYADAHVNLARGLRAAGRPAEAIDSATRAAALAPDLAEAPLQLGRALLDLGRNESAAAAARQALRLDGSLADALVILGNALNRMKDFAGAVNAYRAAVAARPGDVPSMTALAIALSELQSHDEAVVWHRKAVAQDPSSLAAVTGLAVGLGRARDITGAVDACRAGLAIAPDSATLWSMLGSHVATLGRFEEAADCQRRALAIDPGHAEAKRELVAINRDRPDEQGTQNLLVTLNDENRLVRERIAAAFALAGAADRAGDYDEAFDFYTKAHRFALTLHKFLGDAFDPEAMRQDVDRLIADFTPLSIASAAAAGCASDIPVFVVGMPRSGTTLVEQIMSSHPDVFGAGERADVPRIVGELCGRGGIPVADWSLGAIEREASAYLGRLRDMAPGAKRIIDKLPDNIQFLGPIAVLYPNARIVLCRRDLRDVCVSCHTQRFAEGMQWTHDLGDLAARSQQIERLLAHWRRVVKLPILDVQYETLVADQEGQSRRLIDFLGLPWDPACLSYANNERAVLTASRWQVRQPIYTSSIGRWRNYRKHLGPLLEGLQGLVPADD